MNCKDVSELLPAVLDGELRADERPSIEQHLNNCALCRNELELHSMAKRIVQHRLKRATVSLALQTRVLESVRQEAYATHQIPFLDWISSFQFPWKPLAVVGGVLAIVLAVVFVPSSKHRHLHVAPSDDDIIHQTYNNFDKILAGSMLPQINSSDPFDVQEFFLQKASFKVNVPKLRRCRLIGGVFSRYHDAQVAHVMYESGSEPIYFYQIHLDDVLEKCSLGLPDNIKEELMQTGWYIEDHSPNCTLIIRIVDSTVCCTVADLPKEELLTYIYETQW